MNQKGAENACVLFHQSLFSLEISVLFTLLYPVKETHGSRQIELLQYFEIELEMYMGVLQIDLIDLTARRAALQTYFQVSLQGISQATFKKLLLLICILSSIFEHSTQSFRRLTSGTIEEKPVNLLLEYTYQEQTHNKLPPYLPPYSPTTFQHFSQQTWRTSCCSIYSYFVFKNMKKVSLSGGDYAFDQQIRCRQTGNILRRF